MKSSQPVHLRFAPYTAMAESLNVTWANEDGQAKIYITNDPKLNNITLTFINEFDNPITFPAGKPVPDDQLLPTQSAIYLYLNDILPDATIQSIVFSAKGWSSACFKGDTGYYLVIAPDASVILHANDTLTFNLSHLVVAGQPTQGMAQFGISGAVGLPDDASFPQVFVQVCAAPTPENQDLNLQFGFTSTNQVITGSASNQLVLYFSNPNPDPLVPDRQWGPTPPTFSLSFVYGDSAGALTTLDASASISINLFNTYGNRWKPVKALNQGSYPSWEMQPDPNGGQSVLGVGANATTAFLISGLRIPEANSGITFAYLSYTNIPGYNDGFTAIPIIKVEPTTANLQVTPSWVPNATGAIPVTLVVEVAHADYVCIPEINYARPVLNQNFSDEIQTIIESTTTFTLLAFNSVTGQRAACSTEATVTPDLFHRVPTGVILMWSGALKDIPVGWALCDGSNNTPDLRNRFVIGTGSGYAHNTTGGAASITLGIDNMPTHNHSGSTSTDGDHFHTFSANHRGFETNGAQGLTPNDGNPRWDSITSSTGNHHHSFSTSYTGNGRAFASLPPYRALFYIMKIK